MSFSTDRIARPTWRRLRYKRHPSTTLRNLTLKKDFKRSMYQHFQFTREYSLTNSQAWSAGPPQERGLGRSTHLPPSNATPVHNSIFIYATFQSKQSPCATIYLDQSSDCKYVGNIHGSRFVKAFSALLSHSQWCQQHHKSTVPTLVFSVKGT